MKTIVTPEQTVPATPLMHPWESCITMGNSWSYVPNDHYKSSNDLVHLLLKIISRGGNLLLNVGPSPEGDWSDTAYARLKDIGKWMTIHNEAVYNTVPKPPYADNNIIYLQSKDHNTVYVHLLSDASDDVIAPAQLTLKQINLTNKTKIVLLDAPKEKISWKKSGDGIIIDIPSRLQNKPIGKYAITFRIRQ